MKSSKNHIHREKAAHDHEHEEWNRRSFLQTLGLGGLGSMFLGGNYLSAAATQPMMMALNASDNDRVLVLIRLAGGNDGLNTIVPVQDFDIYAQARPTLYHKENTLIKLNDNFSMPNFMNPLESMWGDGKMKVVHGIGYPSQSASHFTGTDIFATADAEKSEPFTKGWIGNYFNNQYDDFQSNPPEKPLAIQIGSSSNLVFNYDDIQYAYVVANPNQLEAIAQSGVQFPLNEFDDLKCKSILQQNFLRSSANSTYKYAETIHEAYINSTNAIEYPEDNSLSAQLATVARLIKGGLGTKIYMVTLGGFDTHGAQQEKHQSLLTDLSLAVNTFYKDLGSTGHDENVLSITFSEFGRRVFENGSKGTDHGKAAPSLLFGPALNGNGFVGEHPDMNNISNNGNINYTTDFRSLYGTVLSEWLCANETSTEASLRGVFEKLDLGFTACQNEDAQDENGNEEIESEEIELEPENDNIPTSFSHLVIYNQNNENPSIILDVHTDMNVKISIYATKGQHIGDILNGFLTSGSYTYNVKELLSQKTLAQGQYIYRITHLEGSSSKMIVIQ